MVMTSWIAAHALHFWFQRYCLPRTYQRTTSKKIKPKNITARESGEGRLDRTALMLFKPTQYFIFLNVPTTGGRIIQNCLGRPQLSRAHSKAAFGIRALFINGGSCVLSALTSLLMFCVNVYRYSICLRRENKCLLAVRSRYHVNLLKTFL